jgi:PIN domain nuclease of toxin-antitoxin system
LSRGLLLDSHVFLWLNDEAGRLNASVLASLADPQTPLLLSVASVAELCIKNALGKLPLPAEIERDPAAGFREALDRMNVTALGLTLEHAARLRDLPRRHRDPFDRLLIAQALEEQLTVVTHDRAFGLYAGLDVLWA